MSFAFLERFQRGVLGFDKGLDRGNVFVGWRCYGDFAFLDCLYVRWFFGVGVCVRYIWIW